jgi:hypothetical protein
MKMAEKHKSGRTYEEIEKEIVTEGFFSEYLPPCFYFNQKALKNPPPQACDTIKPISFSMNRYNNNDARRTIYIPEIGSYLATHMYMKEHKIYRELIELCKNNDHSFSPILDKYGRVRQHEESYLYERGTKFSEYIDNISEKLILASGAKAILKLDISNCYSSFYLHMIPAIALGLEEADKQYKKALLKSTGSDINLNPTYVIFRDFDAVVRRQNSNQTNGLLPGILSSKIIVESLLCRIDKEIEAQGINFVRYVDDYEVFLYDNNIDYVISKFTTILKKYGFTLNSEKTKVLEFPYYIIDNFEKILDDKLSDKIDNADLMEIFNSFYRLEKDSSKGAIHYLLKVLENYTDRIECKDLCKSYLLTIMSNDPRSLTKACELLIENNNSEEKLTASDIKIISDMLTKHIEKEYDLEAIWLLYLLIETNNINAESEDLISCIINSENELLQLMLFSSNLLNSAHIESIKSKAKSWILLYELYQKDIIEETYFFDQLAINQNKTMYTKLKNNNIHFIDFSVHQYNI